VSLISDALRKARQGAGGEGTRVPGPLQPPPRPRRPSIVVVIVVAAVAALAGAAVVWTVVHRRARLPEVGGVQTPRVAAATPSASPNPVVPAVPAATPPATPRGGPVVSPPLSATPVPERRPTPVHVVTTGNTRHRPTPTVPVAPTHGSGRESPPVVARGGTLIAGRSVSDEGKLRARGRTAWKIGTGTAEEIPRIATPQKQKKKAKKPSPGIASVGRRRGAPREIVGEGTVDGIKLTLDYLVYRTNDPFAQINGAEVHVGWEVAGFKVLAIDEESVRLQGKNGPVILRVH